MLSDKDYPQTRCTMPRPLYADFRQVASGSPTSLFKQVVALTGLPAFLGKRVVQRALEARGFDPRRAEPENYLDALPELEHFMATSGPAVAATVNIRRITAHVVAQFEIPAAS